MTEPRYLVGAIEAHIRFKLTSQSRKNGFVRPRPRFVRNPIYRA
jgi:hypothetical protein